MEMLYAEGFALGAALEIAKAASFAAEKHKTQRRKDTNQTPYINHPLAVAEIVAKHLDKEGLHMKGIGLAMYSCISSAILHDTIGGTNTTYDELATCFGGDVADVVWEVTDDKSLPKSERRRQQIAHGPTLSIRAKLVKLADKFHSMSSLKVSQPADWSPEYIQGYFLWSKAVVESMKGTWIGLDKELEDLFKGTFVFAATGETHPCLPVGHETDSDKLLESYYALCK